jgi:hypothetical protein
MLVAYRPELLLGFKSGNYCTSISPGRMIDDKSALGARFADIAPLAKLVRVLFSLTKNQSVHRLVSDAKSYGRRDRQVRRERSNMIFPERAEA